MLTSIHLTGGQGTYLQKLPIWKRKLTFRPGLNLLCGPNGSGKTTLLSAIGALTGLIGIQRGGDRLPQIGSFGGHRRKDPHLNASTFPDTAIRTAFRLNDSHGEGRKRFGVQMKWQPESVSLMAGRDALSTLQYFGQTDRGMEEEINLVMAQKSLSSGQTVLHQIQQTLAGLSRRKPLYYEHDEIRSYHEIWQKRMKVWNEWVDQHRETSSEPGLPMLLMDEPDLSLSPLAQQEFWKQMAHWLKEEKVQVIAISHSPFALAYGHRVETVPGYIREVETAVLEMADTLRNQ